jgi:hypothetical protein
MGNFSMIGDLSKIRSKVEVNPNDREVFVAFALLVLWQAI